MTALPFSATTMVLLLLALPGAAQRRVAEASPQATTVRTEVRVQRFIIRIPRAPFAPVAYSAQKTPWVKKTFSKTHK